MKRPLGIVALCYGTGLLLAELSQPPLFLLFLISFGLTGTAIVFARARPFLIYPLVAMLGWTNLASRTSIVSPHDLRLLGNEAQDVIVRGTLRETPSERLYLRKDIPAYRTLAELEVSALKSNGSWRPAHGQIIISTQGRLLADCYSGDVVEVAGILQIPKSELAPGLFDYRNYLRRQGIHFELRSTPEEWVVQNNRSAPPLADRFLAWARNTLRRGLPEEDQPLRLLCAMTLGSRNLLTAESYAPFVQSGTMHIFAISGLHIALIAAIFVSICRVLRIPRNCCGLIVIPLLWFYTAASGWQPSAVRATLMMTIVIGGWTLKRPTDLLNSLAAAALIILVFDPQQLFQAGFQLSFFVVLSIALLLPPMEKLRDRWLAPDPMLPMELIPRWRRWITPPLRYMTSGLTTSLAAWLGAWPITAYYFHLLSPVTLLANLVMVPLSSLALACNLASLVCGNCFSFATELFNHSAWFWMFLMMKAGEWSVRLPGAFLYVPSPTLADLGIYYTALVGALSGWVLKPTHRKWGITAIAMICVFYGWRWYDSRHTVRIVTVPFYGGGAVYCDAPETDSDLLFDCGNEQDAMRVIEPFLRAQGHNRLQRLVLSHGDIHVMGGAHSLIELVSTREVISSTARFRSGKYKRFINELDELNVLHRQIAAGQSIGHWTVLHPSEGFDSSIADDAALVLRGTFQNVRILLLSELGAGGQEHLINSNIDLRADIVITGMPERGEPLKPALLERIQPKIIVVNDSELPAHKRAKPALKERLSNTTPALFARDRGAFQITVKRSGWKIEAGEERWIGSPSVASQK